MKVKGGILTTRAAVDAGSIDKANRTFEVVFATENPILRNPYWSEEQFFEVLSCSKKSIRSERLDAGVVPLLDTHGNYSVTNQFGIVRSWSIKDNECRAVIQYSSQAAKADMWNDIENGIIRSVSVGAKVHLYSIEREADPKKTPTYRAVDWEPFEISLTGVPADYKSTVRSESGGEEHEIEILNYNLNRSVMTPEEIQAQQEAAAKAERKRATDIRLAVRAAKLDEEFADDLIERALTIEAARTEIEARSKAPKVLTEADVQRAAVEERARVTEIRKLVRTQRSVAPEAMTEEFADDLIERGLTLDASRVEILNKTAAVSPGGPANGGGGGKVGEDLTRSAKLEDMINGMMHRAQPGSVERFAKLDPTAIEGKKPFEPRKNAYTMARFIDIARECLTMRGVNTQLMGIGEIVERSMATTDLPDLFTSTVKRFLRMYYEPIVPEWMMFSRAVNADDFRVKTGVKFDAAVTFEELDEKGEYKESNLMSDEKATLQLNTFARKFSINRQTVINDDLGVLTSLPRSIGIGAKQFQSKKVWGLITGNANCPDGNPLFHAKHGNLGTAGNASVINDASLSYGRTQMRRQKSPQGNELEIVPKYILVPPELQTVAQKQIRPINATQTSNVNIWGDLEPMTNVYLTNAQEWYMIADPGSTTVDGLVHAYLTGQEGLYTESFLDKHNDNLVIKARLDFACALWGWQGWYKNNGAAPAVD